MSEGNTFSDEELTAYLDGETDHAPAAAIARALESDRDLAARLERLSVNTGGIASAFDRLLPEAPAALLPDEPPQPSASKSYVTNVRALVASGLLCLAIGWTASYLVSQPKAETWMDFVAAYQALYSTDTLAHINQSPNAASTELRRVSNALGMPLNLEDVKQDELFDYKRAQVLGYEGNTLIQLAFMTKAGVPVALCIIRSGQPQESGIHPATMEGLSSASWSKGGYAYLLIGGDDPALIERAAAEYRKRL